MLNFLEDDDAAVPKTCREKFAQQVGHVEFDRGTGQVENGPSLTQTDLERSGECSLNPTP